MNALHVVVIVSQVPEFVCKQLRKTVILAHLFYPVFYSILFYSILNIKIIIKNLATCTVLLITELVYGCSFVGLIASIKNKSIC